MKNIAWSLFFTTTAVIFFLSCQKNRSCDNCGAGNPVAKAGADHVVILPTDSVILDGRTSYDPNGSITAWQWSRISGQGSNNITAPQSARTSVRQLTIGIYEYELKVVDNSGLEDRDTVRVIVSSNPPNNTAPIANAGPDQFITSPTNTTTLLGTLTTDAENNIISYAWTKILGPTSFHIVSPNLMLTQVNNLVVGVYQFELLVTDAGGLTSKDTVAVTVYNVSFPGDHLCGTGRPIVNAQLIPIYTLPVGRMVMDVVTAGNKIAFAGGITWNGEPSDLVDIYDISTQTWSVDTLSIPRHSMGSVALGTKMYFGGGENGDGTWPVSNVDIYDAVADTWRVTHLSVPGNGVTAAAVGSKVIFAGGDGGLAGANRDRTIDIFDAIMNTWSTSTLNQPRQFARAVVVGTKAYFAGGAVPLSNPPFQSISKSIEVYDAATNMWTSDTMLQAKANHAAIAVDNKFFWAGGYTQTGTAFHNTCLVEIRDPIAGTSTSQYLSGPSAGAVYWAVIKNNKVLFFRYAPSGADTEFDIYDLATSSWSVGKIPVLLNYAAIIAVNNIVYIAGGSVNGVLSNKVWKLEF